MIGLEIGGSLKAEISRTADMLEDMKKDPEQDIYYIVAFLKDIQYLYDKRRYDMLLNELYERLLRRIHDS
jgi:hypothetical protein